MTRTKRCASSSERNSNSWSIGPAMASMAGFGTVFSSAIATDLKGGLTRTARAKRR